MDHPVIRTVAPDEQARALSLQTLAFDADPIMRWLWPEPHAYVTSFPSFVRGFGGGAFANATAHVTEDFLGGALWLPPGVGPDEAALVALLQASVPESKGAAVFQMLGEIGESHPLEPHWHLAFIGVDPTRRGKGMGAALLRHALRHVDAQGLHAYLESSNPANLTLYQRHGFEIVREVRAGDSPPVFPMIRPPR
jgi:GNAT superfamily N-acetyltransferase